MTVQAFRLLAALAALGLFLMDYPANGGECHPAKQGVDLTLPEAKYLDASYFTDADSLKSSLTFYDSYTNEALPKHKKDYCSRTAQDLANEIGGWTINGKMAFDNPDGDFNTGLCWMHSRFQRAAAYLANYRPDLPPPSDKDAEKIIDRIASGEVVEIPGYYDFWTFSKKYQKQIESKLNSQGYGCFFSGDCWRRVGDVSSESAGELENRMRHLYERMLNRPELIFVRIKGKSHDITTEHAWLVSKVEPIRAKPVKGNPLSGLTAVGYRIQILDSNAANSPATIEYRFGDTSLKYDDDQFLIYEDYDEDVVTFKKAAARYCKV